MEQLSTGPLPADRPKGSRKLYTKGNKHKLPLYTIPQIFRFSVQSMSGFVVVVVFLQIISENFEIVSSRRKNLKIVTPLFDIG